jgi:DNA-binding CsgD family transcriptional regulator
MGNRKLIEKDEFLKEYNKLKSEGLFEKDIADHLFITYDTLYNYKKECGLPMDKGWKRTKRKYERETFIEKYSLLKQQGLSEKQIAIEMKIAKVTLYKYKKVYDVPLITPETKELTNENGLTKEWLEIAKKNGLDSSTVNARIREHHWSVEDACTIEALPKGQKIMKKGERK